MVTFKTGDRVRLICDSTCGEPGLFGLKGQTATILHANDTFEPDFEDSGEWYVVFDEPVPYSVQWEDDPNNQWYVKNSEIELDTPPVLIYDPNQQGDTDEDI